MHKRRVRACLGLDSLPNLETAGVLLNVRESSVSSPDCQAQTAELAAQGLWRDPRRRLLRFKPSAVPGKERPLRKGNRIARESNRIGGAGGGNRRTGGEIKTHQPKAATARPQEVPPAGLLAGAARKRSQRGARTERPTPPLLRMANRDGAFTLENLVLQACKIGSGRMGGGGRLEKPFARAQMHKPMCTDSPPLQTSSNCFAAPPALHKSGADGSRSGGDFLSREAETDTTLMTARGDLAAGRGGVAAASLPPPSCAASNPPEGWARATEAARRCRCPSPMQHTSSPFPTPASRHACLRGGGVERGGGGEGWPRYLCSPRE